MGVQVILDLAASAVLGGIFFLSLLNFSSQNAETKRGFRDEITAQSNLLSVVDVPEEDFRQIGYCKTKSAMAAPIVIEAGADYISFKTDIPNGSDAEGDGTPDIVMYRLGDHVTGSVNPNERELLRKVNSGPWVGSSMGVTRFDLQYLKYNGDTLARPVDASQLKQITAIQVTIKVENSYPSLSSSPGDSLLIVSANWKQLRFEIKSFGKGAI
jgi:hypothetical protein